jgi:transcriptional regulator with XRE-family HTH domain
MTLQQIFIANLKRFRKDRGISQMALAELCDTSGNYIGEIEMGRRIPSFEKIEKIASALNIASYQLFIQEITEKTGKKKEKQTKDFLEELPPNIKKEIISHMLTAIHDGMYASFDPKNY